MWRLCLLRLRLPRLDADLAHGELGPLAAQVPGDDGLHFAPHVCPHSAALPVEAKRHQLADVLVQRDQKGVRLVP